jgi:hypothetical protein
MIHREAINGFRKSSGARQGDKKDEIPVKNVHI